MALEFVVGWAGRAGMGVAEAGNCRDQAEVQALGECGVVMVLVQRDAVQLFESDVAIAIAIGAGEFIELQRGVVF